MFSRLCKKIVFLGIILGIASCVSVGPYITKDEFNKVEEDLRVKALGVKIERTIYVNNIGYKLLKSLNSQEKKYPFLGILVTNLNKYTAKIFGKIPDEGKVIVYGLIKGSPAEKSGLKIGDIILTINNREVLPSNFYSLVRGLTLNKPCRIFVERDFDYREITVYPEALPYYVNFLVVESPDINASAFSGGVAVTYGLLSFIKNDDELAIVLGHELAHLIKGHILKSEGVGILFSALALAFGRNVDIPQSQELGRLLGRIFQAKFSRDFEREADFIGTLIAYQGGFDISKGIDIWERMAIEIPGSLSSNFLANHPTSGERLLRIKKIAEKIRNKEINPQDYLK